jgi:hypothetical protein
MHFCSFIGVYKRGPKHILYQARQLQFLIILSHILICDVFLSKNDDSVVKTREASEGVEYDFYLTEYELGPVWLRILILAYYPIKLIYLW